MLFAIVCAVPSAWKSDEFSHEMEKIGLLKDRSKYLHNYQLNLMKAAEAGMLIKTIL